MAGPSTEKVSSVVLDAAARATGVDPAALPPLYDVVDPDALDALFAPTVGDADGRSRVHVRFTYVGLDVVVRGDGEVDVHRPPSEGDRSSPR